jgi:hypothetical protein
MKQFSGSHSVGASAILVETAYTGMPPSTERHTKKILVLERTNCLLSFDTTQTAWETKELRGIHRQRER